MFRPLQGQPKETISNVIRYDAEVKLGSQTDFDF